MTEDDLTTANAALLLDEKIEDRVHIAVGRLFGFDATKNYWMPRIANDQTLAGLVRNYITQELVREVARVVVSDPAVVRDLYERMVLLNQERRLQVWNTTNSAQRHF